MHYLKQRRIQIILACFAVSALLFNAFPSVDISISRMFFYGGFYLQRQWWTTFMHESMGYFLWLSLSAVVGLYIWNKLSNRNLCGVDGKRVVYVFLVLIVGAGLIVNVVLKDNFGRAFTSHAAWAGRVEHEAQRVGTRVGCDQRVFSIRNPTDFDS